MLSVINAATIDWPRAANGEPLVLVGRVDRAVVFKAGGNQALAEDFVRFLAQEGWLAHWLNFAGDRWFPPMRKLVEQPFWLDPSDPHQMASVMQMSSRSLARELAYDVISGNRGHRLVNQEHVWGNAVHRVVTDGISPDQAVDEAIARIKAILAE
jgi:multiple sugar transport system substrate-binding protein